mmetsp:Transcript_2585/g.5549  ORF Transcript_2585/g.5549 Transcript_2585/m.5549 type:complete len:248 (-) Transcript_2585:427-1170(-)|eukprot:CAMPEP_0172313406 /NCGR_PEP_ID=MMETSP1058-20130122/20154_1 /TAXON_ID=83371 /ORGANISM="Detonula confervacea, Strain CCMP 353" /LENGTH=247 /DNA_ID=CAMNT_0013027051 /DNA_START=34 /DNA_END=777 /DNA_ORIENTATION=+
MSVSPELALAAAAAIKDKALEQQTMELIQLKKQLHASQEVEITGKMGRPVYCRGSFQDGNFRENVGLLPPGVLWEVKLVNDEAFEAGIPLREFWPDMEIRLGGVVFASTSTVSGTMCKVRGAASNNSRDDVFCPITSGDEYNRYNRIAGMAIDFRSLPEGPWKHLQSCATYNSRVANDERDDIFHKISHPTQFPRRIPNQTADITSMCFHATSVLKLIRTVHGDEEFEREKKERLTEIEANIADFAE